MVDKLILLDTTPFGLDSNVGKGFFGGCDQDPIPSEDGRAVSSLSPVLDINEARECGRGWIS